MRTIKRKLLNYLLKHLFKAITEDDVLHYKNKTLYTGSIELSTKQAQDLIQQAKKLQKMEIWLELRRNMEFAANQRMFEKSANSEDLFFGKAMLYSIELLYNKVYNISRLKIK